MSSKLLGLRLNHTEKKQNQIDDLSFRRRQQRPQVMAADPWIFCLPTWHQNQ